MTFEDLKLEIYHLLSDSLPDFDVHDETEPKPPTEKTVIYSLSLEPELGNAGSARLQVYVASTTASMIEQKGLQVLNVLVNHSINENGLWTSPFKLISQSDAEPYMSQIGDRIEFYEISYVFEFKYIFD